MPNVPVGSVAKTLPVKTPAVGGGAAPRPRGPQPAGGPRGASGRPANGNAAPSQWGQLLGGVERPQPVDFTDTGFIFALIVAVVGDFPFLFAIGAAIPAVGVFIVAVIAALHYAAGFITLAILWPHLSTKTLDSLKLATPAVAMAGQFVNPRTIMAAAVVLPLPTLTIGAILALLAQSKIVKFIDALLPALATTAVAVVAAPETGGASLAGAGAAATEVGAAVGEGAAAAGTAAAGAAEAAGAGARAAEGAAQTARAAGAAGRGAAEEAGSGARGAEGFAKEARIRRGLGEEPELMEGVQERLFQETRFPQAANDNEEENEPDTVRTRDRGNVVDLAEEARRRRAGGVVQSNRPDEPASTGTRQKAA